MRDLCIPCTVQFDPITLALEITITLDQINWLETAREALNQSNFLVQDEICVFARLLCFGGLLVIFSEG